MKKMVKSILASLTALTLVLTAVGCGKDDGKTVINKGSGEIPESLEIYASFPSAIAAKGAKSNNDVLTFQAMEELTGCHVNWIHPAEGSGGEKFNLMLVSGDLPDMIVNYWTDAAETGQSYAEDGILIPLTDLIDEYMPNFSALLDENPDYRKQLAEEDGEIYYIPIMAPEEEMKVYRGPQIREDWLEKLGLEIPKTPEDLYTVLKAFKTEDPNGNGKADEIPMSGVYFRGSGHDVGYLLWMFGTTDDFYLKNGKVTHGLLEDEYEEGLRYVTKLYSEGLIDVDFLINDRSKMDAKFMSDRVGFVFSYQPTKYYNAMNDGRKVTGIPHLAKEGVKNNLFDSNRLRGVGRTSIAITTQNENPSGSLKWLDNFYGGEGLNFYNYGVEGVSYDMVDGEPTYKPEVKEESTYALVAAANNSMWVGYQKWDYYKQTLSPWGKDAIETWAKDQGTAGIITPSLVFTSEEKDTIAQVYTQIQTYADEQINKIIVGKESIDKLPEIRERVKEMGIDQIIDIYEAALKRYNSR